MKRLPVAIFLLVTAAGCHPSAPPGAPLAPAPSPAAESVFEVRYREAADVFEILDNLSLWWSGKCDPEYREHWQGRFGVTADDEQRFKAYKAVRKRYYEDRAGADPDPTKSTHGVFARRKPVDRFAEAFYGASDLASAFTALAGFVEPADLDTVKDYFAACRSRYEVLLAESRAYPAIAAAFEEKLARAGTADFARKVADFYGVASLPRFTVLYTWWPPGAHVAANNRGRYLILKAHPVAHREAALRDIDLPVHELVHQVSAHQSEEQKRALTQVFLAGCAAAHTFAAPKILEEPLAVVHQKEFLRQNDPARFEVQSAWYGDPWVSAFAKRLFEPTTRAQRSGRRLDAAFVAGAAEICAKLAAERAASP